MGSFENNWGLVAALIACSSFLTWAWIRYLVNFAPADRIEKCLRAFDGVSNVSLYFIAAHGGVGSLIKARNNQDQHIVDLESANAVLRRKLAEVDCEINLIREAKSVTSATAKLVSGGIDSAPNIKPLKFGFVVKTSNTGASKKPKATIRPSRRAKAAAKPKSRSNKR